MSPIAISRPGKPMSSSAFGAIVGSILAIWTSAARAHGDHDWIRKGEYMGVDGTRCCGVDDCQHIPAARIARMPEGYVLRDYDLFVPFRQTQPSEDGKFWLCRSEQKSMRCFFAPPPGS